MVHVVAYNAASTLARVLDRIPPHVQDLVTEICVFDDASKDDTYLVGEGYRLVRNNPKLRIHRNPRNLGYGGNQKRGYRYAIDGGFDIVVLLHGDGQYAPEIMDRLIEPITSGRADAVFGSRMMDKLGAIRGGMPLYKYLGNRVLSSFENAMLGLELSEFHSGYRVYSVKALANIPFEKNTDDFHFDTQIIIQLASAGYRIEEVPIPTYYGDEICHVNGLRYARDVARSVIEFHEHRAGLIHRPEYGHVDPAYTEERLSPLSSQQRIIDRVRPGAKVLDVGCGPGYLAAGLRAKGCEVVGVDRKVGPLAVRSTSRTYETALEEPWEPEERGFDVIVFADVLEHLRDTSILARARDWLGPRGRIIASTGNVALWFMRLSLLLGRFEYSPRGILDETHVRLYTRSTFRRLVTRAGYHIESEDFTPIPLHKVLQGTRGAPRALLGPLAHVGEIVNHRFAKWWPEWNAYQLILEASDAKTPPVIAP
ncbi:MAG: methyltransferase domain-containing protein [Myxococcales bacterium]|nr:methyltransferase domain-containing protein [Myxococcales bacterium]